MPHPGVHQKHHRDFQSVDIRIEKIVADFGEKPVDTIKSAEIDGWLSRVTKTPAISNRYRALFSLIFREAIRNGKASINPARLVRQRAENNDRIRFLTDDEERSLREAIRERFLETRSRSDNFPRDRDTSLRAIHARVEEHRL